MTTREQRGIVIAATTKLSDNHGVWVVPSQTGSDKRYMVDPRKGTCSCPDCQETGFKCKHQWAVEFTLKREQHADGTVVEQKTFKWTEIKTYKQDWPAYTLAQTTEKHRLQVLLADLCSTVAEPEYAGIGRKSIPITDRLFACAFKVYCGLSVRRYACDMRDAHERGHLSRPLHPIKVCCFLQQPELTPILRELVARSALPLRALETDFAVDSSGFSSSKFVRWYDEKYGTERSGHDWVKAHICTGVRTNCVTAVEIKDRDAADGPMLPPLVAKTAENFTINEVSGDKAYLSVANVEIINELGGTPFIAPKINTTGSAGGLFEKMFHYYQYNREDFMAKYHKRSNVESTFSAVKRKFGDSVRSRNPVAMVNEVLCKFICHNISCVIHSQCELGIEANFWNGQDGNENNILKLVR
jgi:transposase